MKKVLGVDIGGVILDYASIFAPEGVSYETFIATPAIEGSIESLAILNNEIFKGSIYLVSKYDKRDGPEGMWDWLDKQNFYERTGIKRNHLHQCVERHEKAPIVKELGITHFIDDRAEVMSHFANFVPNLYHFQSLLEDKNEWSKKIPNLIFVENWKDLLEKLQSSE